MKFHGNLKHIRHPSINVVTEFRVSSLLGVVIASNNIKHVIFSTHLAEIWHRSSRDAQRIDVYGGKGQEPSTGSSMQTEWASFL